MKKQLQEARHTNTSLEAAKAHELQLSETNAILTTDLQQARYRLLAMSHKCSESSRAAEDLEVKLSETQLRNTTAEEALSCAEADIMNLRKQLQQGAKLTTLFCSFNARLKMEK